MVQFIPAKDDWAQAFRSFGSGLTQGYMGRSDENAVRKAIIDLGPNASSRDVLNALTNVKTYNKDAKQEALKNYLGVENFEELKRKAEAQEGINKEKNRISALGKQTPEQQQETYDNYIARNYTPEEAQAMTSPYVTAGTKQAISKNVEDEIARKIRKPTQNIEQPSQPTNPQPQSQEAPVAQETPLAIEEAEAPVMEAVEKSLGPEVKPKEEEWPEIAQPTDMKPAEVVKWRDRNQAFNNKELKEIRSKNTANQDAMIHYSRLQQLNDTGKVQDGLSRLLLDPETGEPYKNVQKLKGVNKETQQYVKTLNDFISQAKNFFGARVTNFDLASFKSRLPSLLNTEEGRRAIIEQMRLLTELQSLHDKSLGDGLKHYGNKASYSDIVNIVDNKVTEKEKTIINKINHLDTATKYLDMMVSRPKYKGMELMFNSEKDEFVAVRPGDVNALQAKGYEKWRTQL